MSTLNYALDAAMPSPCVAGVLSIGNFDGVHLGHQALLAEAVALSRRLGCAAIAATFDPPPSQLLRPDRMQPPLTTVADRVALLHQFGVDHVLILQTSPALLELSAREFFERIIVRQFQAQALVEGFNFGFGKGRSGTTEVLQALCNEYGLRLILMPPREVFGQPVSSSRVRAELLAGNVDVVTALLGRPYRITGIVGTGAKRGAALGFPTANLQDVPTLLPGNGVYAARAIVDAKAWPAAVNIGPNPTFGENNRKVEAHLIGFGGQLYAQTISIELVRKLRETKSFANLQELKVQIKKDVEQVKEFV